MKKLILVLAIMALVVPAVVAQENHPQLYLFGGYGTSSTYTYYPTAIFQYDGTGAMPTYTKVCDIPMPAYSSAYNSLVMDWDNNNFLYMSNGTSSSLYPTSNALFRYNRTTNTWSTLFKMPRVNNHAGPGSYKYAYPQYGAHVDQNGDYLFGMYEYERKTSPTTTYNYTYAVGKYDITMNTVSTLFTSVQLGRRAYPRRVTGPDIDTGKVMVTDSLYLSSPTTMRYPVFLINPEDGYNPANATFWNTGATYGWNEYAYGAPQNVKNGNIERPYYYYGDRIYRLSPGSGGKTTIATVSTLSFPYRYVYGRSGGFDLQTASKPQFLLNGYYNTTGAGMFVNKYDVTATTWTAAGHTILMPYKTYSPPTAPYRYYYNYQFAFDGGRHIQTVMLAANKWSLLINVPHHPGKAYYCAAGYTGVRPGLALGDGRNINLNFDTLVYMTVNNLIPTIWNPGTGKLDANGKARGSINVAALSPPKGGFGLPIWIAVIVMDPKAPGGIAYVPDTYVIRI